jgi:3-dehydroquinate dehydratase-1
MEKGGGWMRKTVTVAGITIGEGTPKICAPIVGKTVGELIEEVEFLKSLDLDIVEWRVDFFDSVDNIEAVKTALSQIRSILKDTPLIFTFRRLNEGGEREISPAYYVELNTAVVKTGQVEIIDTELSIDQDDLKMLIETAHSNGVFVIISNHDFDKTPSKEEIVGRLRKAQELGGDLPKIAVMPKSAADVLTLLDATNIMKELYDDTPVITMSMDGLGVISRLAGEIFGSALTFGAAKKASAPGQIAVTELKEFLDLLHLNLK